MIKREEIRDALSDMLEQIQDKDLQGKVLDTWMLATEQAALESMAQLKQMPFTLAAESRGISFLEHTLAVTRGAVGLAKAQMASYAAMPYEIDMDRLIAGGLVHDIGKILEMDRDADGSYSKSRSGRCARHPISGAILAAKAGMPDEIVNIIACHAEEGQGRPQVVETVLVHQADFAAFNPLAMMAENLLIK